MTQCIGPVPATTDSFLLLLMTGHGDDVHLDKVRILRWRFSDLLADDWKFVHTTELEDVLGQFSFFLLEVVRVPQRVIVLTHMTLASVQPP